MPAIISDWSGHMNGALTSIGSMVKNGLIVKTINQAVFSAGNPCRWTLCSRQKASQVGSVITGSSWKMVPAASEEEFNALRDEIIRKARGHGYDDVVAFSVQQAEQLFRARKAMMEDLSKLRQYSCRPRTMA